MAPLALPQTRGRAQAPAHVLRFRSPTKRVCSSRGSPSPELRKNPREVGVARWYDPGTGQFMSVDPDLAETDQPYAYAGDDPVNEADLSGMLGSSALQGVADWALQNWNGSYNGFFIDDCTDFASRALHLGGVVPETEPGSLKTAITVARAEFGLPFGVGVEAAYATVEAANHLVRGNLDYWYEVGFYGLPEGLHSDSWAGAYDLAEHEVIEGGQFVVSSAQLPSTCGGSSDVDWSEVHPGDIIFTDFSGSSFSQIDHTGVVVGWSPEGLQAGTQFTGPFSSSYQPGDHLWLAQHSPSQITSLDYWQTDGHPMHVWIVNPADH
jgi:Putative amidase domain